MPIRSATNADTGKALAHRQKFLQGGTKRIGLSDPDGKECVKKRVDRAKPSSWFWDAQVVPAAKKVIHAVSQVEQGLQAVNQMLWRLARVHKEDICAESEIDKNLLNFDGISFSNASVSKEITAIFMALSNSADVTCQQPERIKD